MKICIPSKGRALTIKTHYFFNPIDVLIFVEPQEIKQYQQFNPEYTFIDIGKNDMGVSYARNYILNYVKDDFIIMADDDIESFQIRNKQGRYDTLFNAYEAVEALFNSMDKYIGCSCIVTIDPYIYFTNISESDTFRYMSNTKELAAFVCLNLKKINEYNIRYDENIGEGEDDDFSIQLLKSRHDIAVDYQYGVLSDTFTTGGMSKFRKNSKDRELAAKNVYNAITQKYGLKSCSLHKNTKDEVVATVHFNTFVK